MKKIFISLILFLVFFNYSYSNNVDFYWEKDSSWWLNEIQVKNIKSKIDEIQDYTWLNTDIVILWKNDGKECYLDPNFDNCIKNEYWYASDLIIVLKMKSDISDRWDIRSYMDNKNYPIITTYLLKNIQDSIIYNFKDSNYEEGIIEYYNILKSIIESKCLEIKNENINLWWTFNDVECRVENLKKVSKENDILSEEKKEKNAFKRNINIILSIVLFISFMVWMQLYYLWRLKKLLNDIKFQLLNLDKKHTFKKDFIKIKKDLNKLIKRIEIYLGNADKIWLKLRKYYLESTKKSEEIKTNYDSSVLNFNSQEKLKKEIDDFKNINI